MKNNKKGFTLVELLAVIVILAIVMLVAVTAVGPILESSRKNGFVDNALAVLDGAANYVANEELLNQAPGTCITIAGLRAKGFLQKGNDLSGYVSISKGTSGYTYTVTLSDNNYNVAGKTGDQINVSTIIAGKKTITAPDGCESNK